MSKASEYAKARQMAQPLFRFGQPYSEGRIAVDADGDISVISRDHMTLADIVVTIPKEDVERLIEWLNDTYVEKEHRL